MNTISIVSTKAEDILIDEQNTIFSPQEGGPLLFIEQAIKQLHIPYKTYYGDKLTVEILIKNKKEFGSKLQKQPNIQTFPQKDILDWVIVSTLLNEWNLNNIAKYMGKLFVDIQGYVRDTKQFSKKKTWTDLEKFYKYITCLKGTTEEMQYIPTYIYEDQKQRLLIITKGEDGIELWQNGEQFNIPVEQKVNPKDTLGAGDTFFGNFVGYQVLGEEPVIAALKAIEKTSQFLNKK